MSTPKVTLKLEDLEPGMKVRVSQVNGVWWHPGCNRWDGQVVTVLGHEEDPSRVWSDPMAGGVFYTEEEPAYGFSVRAIGEVVSRPTQRVVVVDHLPDLPEQMRTLPGAAPERDFCPEAGDQLRVPERLYNSACRLRLVNHPDMQLTVAEVRPVAWIVRFEEHPDWWHTRGFLPDFQELAARQAADAPAAPAPVSAVIPQPPAASAEPVAPTPEVIAPTPEVITPTPEVITPAPEAVAPAPEVVAPAPEVVAPAPEVAAPAPEVAAPAPEVAAPAPEVVAPAPKVVAPAPEVSAPEPPTES